MKRLRATLVGLAMSSLVHPGCAGALGKADLSSLKPAATLLEGGEVVVPAGRLGSFLVVEAQIEGKGPFSMIVDTGAMGVFLSQEAAKQLPVGKSEWSVRTRRPGERRAREIGQDVRIGRLSLGGAAFSDFRALAVDLADLSAATGTRIDGLLGFALFGDVVVTLDFPSQRLVLRQARLPAPDGHEVLPFTLASGTPWISAAIAGKSVLLQVDSGSGQALTLPEAAGVPLAQGPVPGPLMATVRGRERSRVARVAGRVEIGRHSIQDPVVFLGDTATVGTGALQHFAVTFDPAGQAVQLVRQDEAPIGVESPRTIGLGFARRAEGWQVVDVIPGTAAAAAGVQVGDVVVAVAGQPVSAIDYTAWLDLLRREASVSVEFLRAGSRTTLLTLPVSDLVPARSL